MYISIVSHVITAKLLFIPLSSFEIFDKGESYFGLVILFSINIKLLLIIQNMMS